MPKRKLTPKEKEASTKKFSKKVKPFISTQNRIDLNPFIKNKVFSPIKIMFSENESTKFKKAYIKLLKTCSKEPHSVPVPLEYYIENEPNVKERFDLLWPGVETSIKERDDLLPSIDAIDKLPDPAMNNPWPLINAVNSENELVLKINLNSSRGRLVEDFKKLLTIMVKEFKKHGRKISKTGARRYDPGLEIYELRQENPRKWTFQRIAEKVFPDDFDVTKKDGANVKSALEKARRFYYEARRLIEGR